MVTLLAGGGRLSKYGWGLGPDDLVKVGQISNIFPHWRQRDDWWELVAPQNLFGQVGRAHLAHSGRWLHRGAHHHQELKVSQLWLSPPNT